MFQPVPPPIYTKARTGLALGFWVWRAGGRRYHSYVYPNSLGGAAGSRSQLGLRFKLGGDEGQHILAASKEDLASRVIGTRLGLVEALKGILLGALGVSLVRLDEGGVEEEDEGLEKARALVCLLLGARDESVQADTADDGECQSGKKRFVF